jgi:hypothetical protein
MKSGFGATQLNEDFVGDQGQMVEVVQVVAAPPDRLRPGSHLFVLPQQTVCATECTSVLGSRPARAHAARTRSNASPVRSMTRSRR